MVTRKERWGLSFRGWLVITFVVVFGVVFLARSVYPFLAVTHRVKADTLVLEGWVHPYAAHAAIDEFRAGGFHRIFTTGGPVTGDGAYTSDPNTSASVGAGLLVKLGVPSDSIQMVPSRVMGRDRTYNSAVALREWLRQHNVDVRGVNIVTENTHARRSRLLYEKAFGDTVAIGVIGVPNPDYDPRRWWGYSEGVKDVLTEGSAYLYARFLFHPDN